MRSEGWGGAGRSSLGLGVPSGLPDLPFRRQPQVWTRRYLPARGSGGHPCSCGRRVAPGLRAPSQAVAGRARRGLRLAPPNFPSPSVGRGGSGGGQAEHYETRRGHQSRSPRWPAVVAAHPSLGMPRRPAPRAPQPQAEGRTLPGRQSLTAPVTAGPAGAPAPAAEGAGVSDLKTHSPKPRLDRHPRAAAPGRVGDNRPHLLRPRVFPAPAHPPPGGKVWGGGDCLGSQFLFPCP